MRKQSKRSFDEVEVGYRCSVDTADEKQVANYRSSLVVEDFKGRGWSGQ